MTELIVAAVEIVLAFFVLAIWGVLLFAAVQWMLTDRRAWRNRRPGYVSDFWGPRGSERQPDERFPL